MSNILINCTNTNETRDVVPGLSLSEIADFFGVKLQYSILGASVNNQNVGLTYCVFQPKRITFFDITNPEGRRMYIRSLLLMLYAAVSETMPGTELAVLHSVSKGLYCELYQGGSVVEPSADDLKAIVDKMRDFNKRELPIERREMQVEEALKLLWPMPDSQRLISQHGDVYTTVHALAGHSAVMYGDMVPNTRIVDVFDVKSYYRGLLLQVPGSINPEEIDPMTRQDKMFATFIEFDRLQELLGIRRLADLNDAIVKGDGPKIIQVAEALHEKKVAEIANMVAERRDKVRVVLIAGPSSSGKTTFSKRLAVQLTLNGINPVNLSIDNYFVNRDRTPRDANGDYDFEAVEAIDVDFFNQQLLDLIAGKEIEIPKYSFIKGERFFDGEKLQLDDKSVIVIEGTHGLTPQLTPMIPADSKFKIYVAPLAGVNFDHLTRIPTTDNRLIRRIVRDYYTRGHNAEATIAMWPSVRRGEDKFIYTNQEEADVMFNTCLLYELAVLKAKAEPILLEVKHNSVHYAEAKRLLRFLSFFKPLAADSIPPTSIMREFLGGSSFIYD